MEAVVLHGLRDYRLEKVPIPEPGLKEILVKVEAVGICASDAKVYLGAPKYWGKEGEKCRMVLPQIPGHEFSGKVVKLGPNAQDHHKVSIGDLVTAEQVVTCNDCRFCLKGDYNVCIKRKVFGFKGLHGAMAEYMIFPAHSRVYKIPEGMDPFHAAFVEPLSIAIHGINRAEIQFSDVVVISGCGPIGLGMISAAQRKSPKLIVALDLFDWKLDIAKRCGASHVFNPLHCNVKEEINKLTENYGCDVYLEVTGNPLSVKQGLDILANHGRFVCMSIFKGEVSVDWSIIGDVKELSILGGHLGPRCWPTAIDMVAKHHLPMEDLITHKFSLSQFLPALQMVVSGSESIKVMLHPSNKA